MGLYEPQHSHNPPAKLPQGRSGASYGMQKQHPALQPATGNCSRPAAQTPSALKGDTSKLTCYKCSKVGHITSDTKCPQYKKPKQRQIFAAQILDDRSDSKQLDHMELPDEGEEAPEEEVEGNLDKKPGVEDVCPEGSQYNNEESSYKEYDGYALPSDDEEPIYIQAMSTIGEESASSALESECSSPAPEEESSRSTAMQFEDVDWKSCWEILWNCYQQALYMGSDPWEFTPWDGIMHICNCKMCVNYKEHILISELMHSKKDSSAGKIQDQYEQGLIRLGWNLAHEGGHLSQTEVNTVEALEQWNHQQMLWLEASYMMNHDYKVRIKELLDELTCECLDLNLQGKESEIGFNQLMELQKKYKELEDKLANHQSSILSSSSDEDIHMRLATSDNGNLSQTEQAESSLIAGVGTMSWDELMGPPSLMVDIADDKTISVAAASELPCLMDELADGIPHASSENVIWVAAAHDDTNIPWEWEFHAAQQTNGMTGECPKPSTSDHHCMVALVKVNSLEVYTLLDTGSTAISITHDFAQVAKLKVFQLENPIPLQLGTVGSCSMINFGARSCMELGTISDDNAYLDVVNIDRYDMIVSILFLWKHRFILDFNQDILSRQGIQVPILTSGQEDLMLAKKWVSGVHAPIVPGGRMVHAMHWGLPGQVAPLQRNASCSLGKGKPPLRGGRNSMFKLWMQARRLFVMKSESLSNFRHFVTVGLWSMLTSLMESHQNSLC